MINNKQECTKAIDLALSGKWDEAHTIVQEINTDFAQWIHAVLHKIEGDVHNSRYWYSRSGLKTLRIILITIKNYRQSKKN